MPLTLPKQHQQTGAVEHATLVVLPLSYRSNRTAWLPRDCQLVRYAQRDADVVAVVLQGVRLLLVQGAQMVTITHPCKDDLHTLMAHWPADGYAEWHVTLATGSGDKQRTKAAARSVTPPTLAWNDGSIKLARQAEVAVKPRRKLASGPPLPAAGGTVTGPAMRPPQVFRLAGTWAERRPPAEEKTDGDRMPLQQA